jgi:hypothetical protein
MQNSERLGHAYFFAKNHVISCGYWREIEWQDSITYSSLTEQSFLPEVAWVILAGGLSDRVVQKKFPKIKNIMFGFSSAELIVKNKKECFDQALKEFNHPGKIKAILSVAEDLVNQSFEVIKGHIFLYGVEYLKTFPYIGEITAYHLAKNIGLPVAKPDRHLMRMSKALGYSHPADLCRKISEEVNEKIALVDVVLWRYATLDQRYVEKIKRFVAK